jgi:hypothetical protein
MRPVKFLIDCVTHQKRIHEIDLRLTKLENYVLTDILLARLSPSSLNHCEVF